MFVNYTNENLFRKLLVFYFCIYASCYLHPLNFTLCLHLSTKAEKSKAAESSKVAGEKPHPDQQETLPYSPAESISPVHPMRPLTSVSPDLQKGDSSYSVRPDVTSRPEFEAWRTQEESAEEETQTDDELVCPETCDQKDEVYEIESGEETLLSPNKIAGETTSGTMDSEPRKIDTLELDLENELYESQWRQQEQETMAAEVLAGIDSDEEKKHGSEKTTFKVWWVGGREGCVVNCWCIIGFF